MKNQIRVVRAKIKKLNTVIDNKIINGQDFRKQAQEHRNYVAYLESLQLAQ